MQLKRLVIDLQTYGENKGCYLAEAEYVARNGEITVKLSPAVSSALLRFMGSELKQFSLDGMAALQSAIVEAAIKEKGETI